MISKSNRKVVGYLRRYQVVELVFTSAPDVTKQIETTITRLNQANEEFNDKQMPDSACIGVTAIGGNRIIATFEWWSPEYGTEVEK